MSEDLSTWFPKGNHPDGRVDAEWQADILDGIGSVNNEGSPLFARGWRNSGGKAATTSLFDWWLFGYENEGTMLFFDPEAAREFMCIVAEIVGEKSIKRKEEVTIVAVLKALHEKTQESSEPKALEHAAGLQKLIAITENTSVEAEECEAELPSARQRCAKARADERAEMAQRREEFEGREKGMQMAFRRFRQLSSKNIDDEGGETSPSVSEEEEESSEDDGEYSEESELDEEDEQNKEKKPAAKTATTPSDSVAAEGACWSVCLCS